MASGREELHLRAYPNHAKNTLQVPSVRSVNNNSDHENDTRTSTDSMMELE